MIKKLFIMACAVAGVTACVSSSSTYTKPVIDTSNDRVKTKLVVPYKQLGVVIPKDVTQTKNNLTVGCETLDRDYADYDAYKEYLAPLGIKKIRLQGGWAKTEKVKGVFDFAWLDHIVNDARSRGIIPWVQTSYGNPIYNGGGTPFLKGGMPCTKEGKEAWNKWVDLISKRYAGKVEWEMWNEPDINRKTPKSETIDINIRTAKIILKNDPKAEIAALSLASTRPGDFEIYIKGLSDAGMLDKFKWVTYHGYQYRPEASYENVDQMREILAKYSKKVLLRQGENGAPSKGFMGGALTWNPWTEFTQAKWDLRRMLGENGGVYSAPTAPRGGREQSGQGGLSCNPGGASVENYRLMNFPLGMVYSPIQEWRNAYDVDMALERGTLFRELDMPWEVELPTGRKGGLCCE
jgi:hypothetical protein